jgi:predicted DCC family thiol-disulfide oxidoreductase YuxK
MDSTDLILFDADCVLCRSLAELASKRAGPGLRFVAWQDYTQRASLGDGVADRLRARIDGELVEGEAAWAALIARHRDLAGLDWLAGKLGLTKQTARAASRAGGLLRKICRSCGK